jgi:hypothetical protein
VRPEGGGGDYGPNSGGYDQLGYGTLMATLAPGSPILAPAPGSRRTRPAPSDPALPVLDARGRLWPGRDPAGTPGIVFPLPFR